jgi:glycosyltransferase involved in cell wall biosynthesis
VGQPSLWSDYRGLLEDLDAATAEVLGELEAEDVATLMRDSAVLVVPSVYEPFGLTVAEALASGLPVVASDEVGAAQGLVPPSCEHHPAGDVDSAESALSRVLDRLAAEGPARSRAAARAVAEERFAAGPIGEALGAVLREAAGPGPDRDRVM